MAELQEVKDINSTGFINSIEYLNGQYGFTEDDCVFIDNLDYNIKEIIITIENTAFLLCTEKKFFYCCIFGVPYKVNIQYSNIPTKSDYIKILDDLILSSMRKSSMFIGILNVFEEACNSTRDLINSGGFVYQM